MKALSSNEGLTKSRVIKKREFPTRKDYEQYFGGSSIWTSVKYVEDIHKHWHGRGQNGCVFAQHLAKKETVKTGWHSNIFFENEFNQKNIDRTIELAIDNPDIEVLSLLFPNVVTLDHLTNLVKNWINNSNVISLESATRYNDRICLSLRLQLGQTGISSWLMMFAPFTFFPSTRQSPITELAIRVKPKPKNIYPKLSQDRKKAHLADTPFFLPESIVDSTWEATFRNTEYLLGFKPDLIAAAKTTISFEEVIWKTYLEDLRISIQDYEDKEIGY